MRSVISTVESSSIELRDCFHYCTDHAITGITKGKTRNRKMVTATGLGRRDAHTIEPVSQDSQPGGWSIHPWGT